MMRWSENADVNRVLRNIVYNCEQFIGRGAEKQMVKDNLIMDENPGFVDAAAMNFRLKSDSAVYEKILAFEKIPFEKIGLRRDEYRHVRGKTTK
jgi:hypothetical protein